MSINLLTPNIDSLGKKVIVSASFVLFRDIRLGLFGLTTYFACEAEGTGSAGKSSDSDEAPEGSANTDVGCAIVNLVASYKLPRSKLSIAANLMIKILEGGNH